MKENFKRINIHEQEKIYGGFQMGAAILIPFVLQAIITSISSLKMMFTDNGSFSYNGLKSDWSQNKDTKSSAKTQVVNHEHYYSF